MKVSIRSSALLGYSWNAFRVSWFFHRLHRLGEEYALTGRNYEYGVWMKAGAQHP